MFLKTVMRSIARPVHSVDDRFFWGRFQVVDPSAFGEPVYHYSRNVEVPVALIFHPLIVQRESMVKVVITFAKGPINCESVFGCTDFGVVRALPKHVIDGVRHIQVREVYRISEQVHPESNPNRLAP